jgi:formylglycine-generating enzyme required for sulfatase activity
VTRFPTLTALIPLILVCGCIRFGYQRSVDAGETSEAGEDAGVPGEWITVASGTFTMGSAQDSPCRYKNEDLHQVTLTRSYEIQSTEVTQEQFETVMGYNPSHFTSCGRDCPVEMVTWHQAAAYCSALSARAGRAACYQCQGSGPELTCAKITGASIYACEGYRLPTEAEWEHAYRAGTTTTFYSGSNDPSICRTCSLDENGDKIGWYCINSGSTTHPVGQKQPNAWGLFDMAGNVWEWCHDGYEERLGTAAVTDPFGTDSDLRLARGGAWINHQAALHASQRYSLISTYRNNGVGFRCVRSIGKP